MNMQFRQDLRICLGGDNNASVTLRATGASWDLVTWVGHPSQIPGLMASTAASSYRSTKEPDDLTLARVAAARTSDSSAVSDMAAVALAAILLLRKRRARR